MICCFTVFYSYGSFLSSVVKIWNVLVARDDHFTILRSIDLLHELASNIEEESRFTSQRTIGELDFDVLGYGAFSRLKIIII